MAAGDVDGDGQAEILVSKAGGHEVRIYKADGSLANFFNTVDKTVVSSLGYGSNMEVELPVTTTLPEDPDEPADLTHVHWGEIARHLEPGDEVLIKVVAADEADDPMATPQLESIEEAENAEEDAA